MYLAGWLRARKYNTFIHTSPVSLSLLPFPPPSLFVHARSVYLDYHRTRHCLDCCWLLLLVAAVAALVFGAVQLGGADGHIDVCQPTSSTP